MGDLREHRRRQGDAVDPRGGSGRREPIGGRTRGDGAGDDRDRGVQIAERGAHHRVVGRERNDLRRVVRFGQDRRRIVRQGEVAERHTLHEAGERPRPGGARIRPERPELVDLRDRQAGHPGGPMLYSEVAVVADVALATGSVVDRVPRDRTAWAHGEVRKTGDVLHSHRLHLGLEAVDAWLRAARDGGPTERTRVRYGVQEPHEVLEIGRRSEGRLAVRVVVVRHVQQVAPHAGEGDEAVERAVQGFHRFP